MKTSMQISLLTFGLFCLKLKRLYQKAKIA